MISRTVRGLLVSLLVVAAASDPLGAQTCLGTAPLSSGPMRVGLGIANADESTLYGGEVTLGAGGFFVGAALQRQNYSDFDASATVTSATAGYTIPLGAQRNFELCPMLAYSHQSGPEFDLFGFGTMKLSGNAIGFGGSAGTSMPINTSWDLVPSLGALYTRARATLEFDGESERVNEDYTLLTFGAGFVLNRRITIQPRIAYPLGVEDPEPVYGVTLSYTFGR